MREFIKANEEFLMPRGARLDAVGALHHVMVRGIKRTMIVVDDTHRQDFLNLIGKAARKRNWGRK
jgi:hypothetical protein